MIKVYLTKKEKTKLRKAAKTFGTTMSTWATYKFLACGNTPVVGAHPPKNRTEVFSWSVKRNLKARLEMEAYGANTSMTEYSRAILDSVSGV